MPGCQSRNGSGPVRGWSPETGPARFTAFRGCDSRPRQLPLPLLPIASGRLKASEEAR